MDGLRFGEIVDFEYIVTSSNLEALILELNLIKKYDPKYNIQLKDDKTYPFIKITAEKQPRLLIARNVKKDKGKYFGPYPKFSVSIIVYSDGACSFGSCRSWFKIRSFDAEKTQNDQQWKTMHNF